METKYILKFFSDRKLTLITFYKRQTQKNMFGSTRKIITQTERLTIAQMFGAGLLIIGVLLIIVSGFVEAYSDPKKLNLTGISSLIAIGFFIIMLGMVFFFPDMLKSSSKNATSSMRVAIFMIVSVFVFLCVKIGWACQSLDDFKIDSTWAYILAVALGSKTVQSFSETRNLTGNIGGRNFQLPSQNSLPTVGDIPLHDLSTIDKAPPATAPKHIFKN